MSIGKFIKRMGTGWWVLLALSGCSPTGGENGEAVTQVRQQLTQSPVASVTVRLRGDLTPAELAQARLEIEQSLTAAGSRVTYNFTTSPSMGLLIASDADLEALAANPNVESFSIAEQLDPLLNETRAIVGADDAFAASYDGSGRTVAVLDSGIEGSHTDLGNDVVDEACFCAASNCCPNGTFHQFGSGAAAEARANGHGTHVSGIITSTGSIAPRGVAPNTKIVAVRVLEGTDTNDIIAGLEWVRIAHPEIDAVNLSVGTFAAYGDNCDLAMGAPVAHQAMGAAVQALRDDGIITVIASGNNGTKTNTTYGLAFPACVSAALSVGATDKGDVPAEFSHASVGLDLLAPGAGYLPETFENPCNSGSDYCVLSAGVGNSVNRLQGTSQAAPHVTAAISLLRQADENLTPEEIEACLEAGPLVTDPAASNLQKPRLDIPAAFEACGLPLCVPQSYQAESIYHSAGAAAPPDGWNLHSNGYISTTHDFTAGPVTVTVRALGQSAGGSAPHMVVSVDGDVVGSAMVSATTYTDYAYTFEALDGVQEIRITFDNDFYNGNTNPPQDRNLWIDHISVACADEVPPGPCDGLCTPPQYLSWSGSSYQSGNLGTGTICRETLQPVVNGNCGNFAGGRQLRVNGAVKACNGAPWSSPPVSRNGGYCIQTTAGNHSYAYFTLW